MGVWIVSTMTVFVHYVETKAVEGASFVIPDWHLETMLQNVYIALFSELEIDSLMMNSPY